MLEMDVFKTQMRSTGSRTAPQQKFAARQLLPKSARKPEFGRRRPCKVQNNVLAEKRGDSGIDVQGFRPTSPRAWEIISTTLKENKTRILAAQELLFEQKEGTPVLDIRPEAEYEAGFIPGSVNVEFYRLITGWDTRKALRRAAFAFFGVLNGTEVNPNFLEEARAAIGDKREVVLVCNIGGTLEETGPSKFGRQSRSLMAAYELLNAGCCTRVNVLKGGFSDWNKSGREVHYLVNQNEAEDSK